MSGVRPTIGDSSWFTHDRFGLFIHWGIYALPARHEWVKQREQIPDDVYDRYFRHFDPDLYDPKEWARVAAQAGMKYFVITTKHHDGFCLWDSKLTDYKSTNTPCGKDLLRPMLDAFRERGLRVGLYHSLIDWHHPDFVIDDLHPMRNHPDRAKMNETRDQKKYIAYLHGQVAELLTNYGPVDILFYDFSYPPGVHGRPATYVGKGRNEWGSKELIALTRRLQPKILVDNRLDLDDVEGGWDYRTPEQFEPAQWLEFNGQRVVWETCQTFSGSWGYHRDESTWKSVEQLLGMLINTVSKGGNLLLNVGPTARGEFDSRAMDRLAGMSEWMKRHGRSIYGCTEAPAEFKPPRDCRLTWNPDTKRLYVHIMAWPFRALRLEGESYVKRLEYAQLLNDGSETPVMPIHQGQEGMGSAPQILLSLPVQKPNVTIPVVELFMK
ncbi:MAG TPA: alpha-L-fucosidase [Candidatus Brocadiia bacterium]|nr:alpha-L-fucosidase [Candidatus Brocadiia bacterium]